jgi:hypothetical protein
METSHHDSADPSVYEDHREPMVLQQEKALGGSSKFPLEEYVAWHNRRLLLDCEDPVNALSQQKSAGKCLVRS